MLLERDLFPKIQTFDDLGEWGPSEFVRKQEMVRKRRMGNKKKGEGGIQKVRWRVKTDKEGFFPSKPIIGDIR